jgi:hypothetical protein
VTATWRTLPLERRFLASPAWFVPYDDFFRRPYEGPLLVELDRWDGTQWLATGVRPVFTPGGVVAYPGLGRRREPGSAEPELYRARFTAPGYQTVYADDLDSFIATALGKEFLAYPFDDQHPPQLSTEPELVRLVPDRTFAYPPGTRIVHGVVRWAGSAQPVEHALVQAVGQTVPEGHEWHERTLTDATGAFRLSLRWSGVPTPEIPPRGEDFTVTAIERPGHTGTVGLRLPDDLNRTHVIEISE